MLAMACSFMATEASAQLLNNLSIGNPKALGLANAVTADPPGIDSIHFNPAGLVQIQGRQANLKFLLASVEIESSFGEPTLPTDVYDFPFDPNDPNPDPISDQQLYYNLTQQCQDDYPIGDPTDIDEVAGAHALCWGEDPVANTVTTTGNPVLMVPFMGLQESPVLLLPMGGMAFEGPSGDWAFGSAVYVPEGIGYSRDIDSGGAYQGQEVGLTRVTYFSPTVAVRVTDRLSAGVGITFSYHGLGIKTNFRASGLTLGYLRNLNSIPDSPLPAIDLGPYDNVGLLTMEMEDLFSVGFNFGLLWEANDWLTLGFSYRSESIAELEGDYSMEYTDSFIHTMEGLQDGGLDAVLAVLDGGLVNAVAVEKGTVKSEYIVPQSVSFGASVQLLPRLRVNLDAKWIEYSRWDELTFSFSQNNDFLTLASVINTLAGLDYADPDELRIPRGYEDTWSWAIGAEYQWNNNLVLRAGYEPRSSAIPDDRTDLLFPIGDAELFTAGVGWQYDQITRVEAAVGYLYSHTKTDACESRNANSCKEGDVVYNPYFATPFENEVNAYLVAVSIDRKF
ncbi:MAG: outer membrane protein transport protein [Pseudomonadota bacterium]|nr:outer membrane protein transport protein [Pseudomonadota bacterium]